MARQKKTKVLPKEYHTGESGDNEANTQEPLDDYDQNYSDHVIVGRKFVDILTVFALLGYLALIVIAKTTSIRTGIQSYSQSLSDSQYFTIYSAALFTAFSLASVYFISVYVRKYNLDDSLAQCNERDSGCCNLTYLNANTLSIWVQVFTALQLFFFQMVFFVPLWFSTTAHYAVAGCLFSFCLLRELVAFFLRVQIHSSCRLPKAHLNYSNFSVNVIIYTNLFLWFSALLCGILFVALNMNPYSESQTVVALAEYMFLFLIVFMRMYDRFDFHYCPIKSE